MRRAGRVWSSLGRSLGVEGYRNSLCSNNRTWSSSPGRGSQETHVGAMFERPHQ